MSKSKTVKPGSLKRVVSRLEDTIGQIVRCNDGNERKVIGVTQSHVTYSVQCGPEWWMELSPTHRRYIERDFIGAEVVG